MLLDRNDDSSVIPHIDPQSFERLKAEGRIADGMIPKLESAFKALGQGVVKVTVKHAADLLKDAGTTLSL